MKAAGRLSHCAACSDKQETQQEQTAWKINPAVNARLTSALETECEFICKGSTVNMRIQ